MLKIDILTLFPNMFDGVFQESILKRAIDDGKIEINLINFRDFTNDPHNKVDDTPYGGGAGMVLMAQPIFDCVKSIRKENSKVILLTPDGIPYKQKMAYDLCGEEHLILICGHYEGFDERIRSICDMEISIGDYVLTGGELPSMIVSDAVTRLVDGVIETGSHKNDSFNNDKLDYPTYTKPREYDGMKVPDVLLSGDHKKIEEWRKIESIKRTKERRPDLIYKYTLIKSTLTGKIKMDELNGYSLNPKNNAKRTDVISIKNLQITDTKLTENMVKKNIERKLQHLFMLVMKVLDTDSDDDDLLVLDEADRIKALLNNEYSKILGEDYKRSVKKKIDYIILEFKQRKKAIPFTSIEKSSKSR